MRDADKTKGQLLDELADMRQRIAELENAACFNNTTGPKPIEEAVTPSECVLETLRAEVDERKRAEEALRTSQHRLGSILRAAPTGIGVVVHRTITEVNEALCNMTGYAREDLIGKRSRMLYATDEDFNVVGNEKDRQIAERGIGSVETHWQRKDGKVLRILISSAPIDPSDLSKGVTFAAVDITERKLAEDALQDSEARYRRIVATVPGVIYDYVLYPDGSNHFLYLSPLCIEIFEVEAEIFLSDPSLFWNMVHPDDINRLAEEQWAAKQQGKYVASEVRIITPSGLLKWIQLTSRPNPSVQGSGGPVIWSGLVLDITDRKQAEKALQWKTALLEAQVNTSTDGILVVDENNRRIITNRRLIDLLGVPQDILNDVDDAALLRYAVSLVKYPAPFLEKVVYLYDHPSEASRNEVEFKNGMVLDRYSAPVVGEDGHYYGRIWTFRDMTDRQQAEKALKKAEEKYRNLVENAVFGILQTTPNGVMLSANPFVARMHGHSSPERMIAEVTDTRQLYVDPEVRRRLMEILERQGSVEDFEAERYRSDGTTIWTSATARLVRDPDGTVLYIEGMLQDITARKRAEEALKQSEARFRSYVERSPLAVFVTDKEGRLIQVNRSAAELLGYDVASLSHMHIWELHPAADREEVLRDFALLSAEARIDTERRFQRRDGSHIWVSLHAAMIEGGFSLAYCWDVTRQKQAEEIMRRYELLSGNSRDIILFIGRDAGNIIEANEAAERAYGYSREELLKLTITDLYADESMESMAGLMAEGDERGILFETIHRRKDGSIFPAEVSSRGAETNGTPTLINVVRDVTNRKQMEEEILRSREELRSLADHLSTIREDEKGKIARELHDELGQSLTAVSYDLHWLRKKVRKDQGTMAEKIDVVSAITKGTIETIKRIQGELRPSMLDNLGLCETMDWQARQFTERTRIPVAFDWDHETVIDQKVAVALFRIFQEALTNVARHAGATEILVELLQDDNEVRLTVSDNGRGIEKDELHKPLSFGLIGMKERVEAFGGSLIIQGSPGEGTTLTVRIPRKVAQSD